MVCLLGHCGRLMLSSGVVGCRGLFACLVGDGRLVPSSSSSVMVCGGLVISFPSHRLIQSTRHRLRLIGSSHRLIISSTEMCRWFSFFSLSPDPLPSALLGLLAWACSPVPGRGMCGLRHGLRRWACGLLACVPVSCVALSLPLVRLLLYASVSSFGVVLSGALWGVLRAILPAYLSALAFFNICP